MPQSFAALHCHIIFSTKSQQPAIPADLRAELFQQIGGILKHDQSLLVAAGGMPDHIHLLVSLSRALCLADVVRQIKTNTSTWLRHELNQPHFRWQTGYAAFSVSYSHLDRVKNYLANQTHHHRVKTFQDEVRDLLRRHDIEGDEQHLWD